MKITVTFELELDDAVTEAQKMETLHKIDQAIDTLKPLEMVKRTVIGLPFHVHGCVFTAGRTTGKSKMMKDLIKDIDKLTEKI